MAFYNDDNNGNDDNDDNEDNEDNVDFDPKVIRFRLFKGSDIAYFWHEIYLKWKLSESKKGKYVEALNIDTVGKVLTSDNMVLDIFQRDFTVNAANNEDESDWIKSGEEFKDNYITEMAGFKYIPLSERTVDIENNPYKKVLELAIRDPETIEFKHIYLLQSLFGIITTKAIVVLFNLRRNTGKSTYKTLLNALLGSYYSAVASEQLLQNNPERTKKLLYRLQSKRIFSVSETQRHQKLNIGLMKEVTYGKAIKPTYLTNTDAVFDVQGRFLLDTNELLPRSQDNVNDLEDRVYYIPFGTPFFFKGTLPPIEEITKQENLDCFGSWLIDTYGEYAKKPLPPPTELMKKVALLEELSHDSARMFVKQCAIQNASRCAPKLSRSLTVREIYHLYARFVRVMYVYIVKELQMHFDQDGGIIADDILEQEIAILGERQLTSFLEKYSGGRPIKTNGGMVFTNIIFTKAMVSFFDNPAIHSEYKDYKEVLKYIDSYAQGYDRANDLKEFSENRVKANVIHQGLPIPPLPMNPTSQFRSFYPWQFLYQSKNDANRIENGSNFTRVENSQVAFGNELSPIPPKALETLGVTNHNNLMDETEPMVPCRPSSRKRWSVCDPCDPEVQDHME